MTHDKPEPPDMRGDAVTLRQKIQDRIVELEYTRSVDDKLNYGSSLTSTHHWCSGSLHALETVIDWLDEQEIGT